MSTVELATYKEEVQLTKQLGLLNSIKIWSLFLFIEISDGLLKANWTTVCDWPSSATTNVKFKSSGDSEFEPGITLTEIGELLQQSFNLESEVQLELGTSIGVLHYMMTFPDQSILEMIGTGGLHLMLNVILYFFEAP